MNEENAQVQPPVQPHVQPQVGPQEHDLMHTLRPLLRTYGLPAAVGLVVVVSVVSGSAIYRSHARAKEAKASAALFSAQSIQDLEKLARRSSATPSAALAVLRIAKEYYDAGDFNMALAKYDEFSKENPDHRLMAVAQVGRIHCLEARGQLDEALKAFSAFAAEHPGHYLVPQALFGQGRCLEHLGRAPEAKALYEDFIAANPDSGWLARAEQLLADIAEKIEAGETGIPPRGSAGEWGGGSSGDQPFVMPSSAPAAPIPMPAPAEPGLVPAPGL